jgi:hypothetical protein
MSFDEKRILSQNINLLAADQLGKIVHIIHQRMPWLAGNGDRQQQDEIEIDIDALDAGTLRALERFVHQQLHSTASSTSPTGLAHTKRHTKSMFFLSSHVAFLFVLKSLLL